MEPFHRVGPAPVVRPIRLASGRRSWRVNWRRKDAALEVRRLTAAFRRLEQARDRRRQAAEYDSGEGGLAGQHRPKLVVPREDVLTGGQRREILVAQMGEATSNIPRILRCLARPSSGGGVEAAPLQEKGTRCSAPPITGHQVGMNRSTAAFQLQGGERSVSPISLPPEAVHAAPGGDTPPVDVHDGYGMTEAVLDPRFEHLVTREDPTSSSSSGDPRSGETIGREGDSTGSRFVSTPPLRYASTTSAAGGPARCPRTVRWKCSACSSCSRSTPRNPPFGRPRTRCSYR